MKIEKMTNKVKPAAAAGLAAGLLLMASGCATSNYRFDELSHASGHVRAQHLGEALKLEQEDGKGEDLYDMKMAPLFHTHLNVFARADEEGIPSGFVEADIDAYLPLLGFIDSTVQRYDDNHEMYEGHEYKSYLWGLYQ